MNQEDKAKALDDIKMALAKYIHDFWSDTMQNIYDNSRQNKGGSVTISKTMAEEIEEKMNIDFFDLTEDVQKNLLIEAGKAMSAIKLILETQE